MSENFHTQQNINTYTHPYIRMYNYTHKNIWIRTTKCIFTHLYLCIYISHTPTTVTIICQCLIWLIHLRHDSLMCGWCQNTKKKCDFGGKSSVAKKNLLEPADVDFWKKMWLQPAEVDFLQKKFDWNRLKSDFWKTMDHGRLKSPCVNKCRLRPAEVDNW